MTPQTLLSAIPDPLPEGILYSVRAGMAGLMQTNRRGDVQAIRPEESKLEPVSETG